MKHSCPASLGYINLLCNGFSRFWLPLAGNAVCPLDGIPKSVLRMVLQQDRRSVLVALYNTLKLNA